MWTMTFINRYGVQFIVRSDEPGLGDVMDYIKYCLDAKSILVDLKQED